MRIGKKQNEKEPEEKHKKHTKMTRHTCSYTNSYLKTRTKDIIYTQRPYKIKYLQRC